MELMKPTVAQSSLTCSMEQIADLVKSGLDLTIRFLALLLLLHWPSRTCSCSLQNLTIIFIDLSSAHCRLCFCKSQSRALEWLYIMISGVFLSLQYIYLSRSMMDHKYRAVESNELNPTPKLGSVKNQFTWCSSDCWIGIWSSTLVSTFTLKTTSIIFSFKDEDTKWRLCALEQKMMSNLPWGFHHLLAGTAWESVWMSQAATPASASETRETQGITMYKVQVSNVLCLQVWAIL
jgi:hypothetical protein